MGCFECPMDPLGLRVTPNVYLYYQHIPNNVCYLILVICLQGLELVFEQIDGLKTKTEGQTNVDVEVFI